VSSFGRNDGFLGWVRKSDSESNRNGKNKSERKATATARAKNKMRGFFAALRMTNLRGGNGKR
jgi:hypothetical protein